ncbi:MAG: EAL domain-containing protein [Eubacteriales bacterium]
MKSNLYKILFSFLTFTLLIFFSNFTSITSNAQTTSTSIVEDPTIIKVGYILNYGTIKSPILKGEEGYGYEYLNKIFEYADGNYELEFIYCEWEESKTMLANGELDIIGPTTYSDEGTTLYQYPDNSFGDNIIFLSTLSKNNIPYKSYGDINGSKIAVQQNNPNEYMLHEFLDENNFEAEILYFTDNDYEEALESLNCDFCLSSSLQTFKNLSPIATLGFLDFYYVTDINNLELVEIINSAMEELEKHEFFYQEKLYLNYYNYNINSSYYVTNEEYTLLQSQELYTVGVYNFNSPISYIDTNGNLTGIALDTLNLISESAGINYKIMELTEGTIENADYDFAFTALSQDDCTSIVESEPYYEIPLLLVERVMVNNASIKNIGILSYYGITEIELEGHIYGRKIYEYSSVSELQNAYNNGIIDSFIITTTALNSIRNNFYDMDFISNTLDSHLALTVAFPTGYSSEKIAIFNKIITRLNETDLDTSALKHSTTITNNTVTLYDIWNKYHLLIVGIFCMFVLLFAAFEWKRRKALSKFINIDPLTGLFSQHKFLIETQNYISQNPNGSYTIISLDIDNFKYINEFYSYETGSKILTTVGKNIQAFAATAKFIGRAHADNFLILAENQGVMEKIDHAKQEDGNGLYEQLRKYVGEIYDITFSIGLYEVNDKNLDLNFMIDCANIAKDLGKDIAHTTVNKYTAEMDKIRITNNDIVANMASAIENEEFILYYQPKLDLKTRHLVGAEALVRWIKDDKSVPPNHFIPLFERNGFIVELDYYILTKTCELIEKYPQVPKISFNLSGITVMENNLVDIILGIVNSYEVPYEKIDIEITESAFVQKFEQSRDKIKKLQSLGFTISMDDFGSGISSLNRLKNIPIDTLKIDCEFIIDSMENPRGRQIIKNVVNMAKDLNLETVAEGIETQEQEAFLLEVGCNIGQGYFFSMPIPEDEFIRYINR